jgi:hypothetical protein
MQLMDSGMSVAVEFQKLLTSIRIERWLQESVFHFRWWFLLALFLISAFTWCKLVDKTRLPEIVLYVGLTTIITLVLDEFGIELTLWSYPVDLLPIFPPLTAVDLASLPTIYSLIYQHFGTWRSFTLATVIMATIFCFVCEPILVWGDFYQVLKWKYYYGFPIYIAMALFIRWMVVTMYTIASKAEEKSKSPTI